MASTQMESGAPACVECDGRGDVVMGPACDGCGCGGWLHGVEVAPCPRCEGSKVEPCDLCGEPSVTRYLGDDLCASCAPPEDERFDSCSICSAPIDVRESHHPLCDRHLGSSREGGRLAAEATRQERAAR